MLPLLCFIDWDFIGIAFQLFFFLSFVLLVSLTCVGFSQSDGCADRGWHLSTKGCVLLPLHREMEREMRKRDDASIAGTIEKVGSMKLQLRETKG